MLKSKKGFHSIFKESTILSSVYLVIMFSFSLSLLVELITLIDETLFNQFSTYWGSVLKVGTI